MADAGNDRPSGGLAAEALRRGKQLRRRRILVRRGATSLVLASAVAVGIALRVGGTPSPAVSPVGHPTTENTAPAPTEPPTTPPTTSPPTTTPPTTTPPTTTPPTTVPPTPVACGAAQLSGSFAAVPGGRSAGHIVYLLQLRNVSSTTCTVQGPPGMLLRGTGGTALPTHTSQSGGATTLTLAPGRSAYSAVQFSPDVPGPGEPTTGQCEPTAETVDVTLPGLAGAIPVALQPASPVCEQGQLDLTALSTTYPPNA